MSTLGSFVSPWGTVITWDETGKQTETGLSNDDYLKTIGQNGIFTRPSAPTTVADTTQNMTASRPYAAAGVQGALAPLPVAEKPPATTTPTTPVATNSAGTTPPFVDPNIKTQQYVPMGGSNGYQRSARENLSAMLQSGRSAIATRSQAPISARQVIQGGAFNPGVRTVAAPVYKAPDPVTPISVSSDYLTSAINKILGPEVAAPPAAAPAPAPTPIINDYGGGG